MSQNRDGSGRSGRTCRRCGSGVPTDAQFCSSCGSPRDAPETPLICGYCGHTVEVGQRNCVSCGTALSREPPTQSDDSGNSHATRERTPERGPSAERERTPDGEPSADAASDGDERDLDEFRSRLGPYLENGWEMDQDDGDSVELSYHDYGSTGMHVAIVLCIVTLGWGNVLYAIYSVAMRQKNVTLHAASDPTHWPEPDPTPSHGPLHWVLGVAMVLFTGWIAVSETVDDPANPLSWLWLGGCLLATATLLPPVNRRLKDRGSLTEFGWQTRTEEQVVHSAVQCTGCSSFVDSAVERSFEKYFAVAGVPVKTAESGENYYCEECCESESPSSIDREIDELPGEPLDDDTDDTGGDSELGELLDDADEQATDWELDKLLDDDADDAGGDSELDDDADGPGAGRESPSEQERA